MFGTILPVSVCERGLDLAALFHGVIWEAGMCFCSCGLSGLFGYSWLGLEACF